MSLACADEARAAALASRSSIAMSPILASSSATWRRRRPPAPHAFAPEARAGAQDKRRPVAAVCARLEAAHLRLPLPLAARGRRGPRSDLQCELLVLRLGRQLPLSQGGGGGGRGKGRSRPLHRMQIQREVGRRPLPSRGQGGQVSPLPPLR
jgi:hypothetical protein